MSGVENWSGWEGLRSGGGGAPPSDVIPQMTEGLTVVVDCPGNYFLCWICGFLSHHFNVLTKMPEYVKKHKIEKKHLNTVCWRCLTPQQREEGLLLKRH